MAVKRFIVKLAEVGSVVDRLRMEGLQRAVIFFPGSKEHAAKGLQPDVALVRAWNDGWIGRPAEAAKE